MKENYTLLLLTLVGLLGGSACRNNANSAGKAPEAVTPAVETTLTSDLLIIPGRRVGLVNAGSSPQEILRNFGEKNVRKGLLNLYEGEDRPGFVIFPDTDKELEIALSPDNQPQFVRIYREHSPWHTPEGVRIGTSLVELQKINGTPFTFYGFDWDYGGLVTNWNGGLLSPQLIIALAPGNPHRLIQPFKGEVNLYSDDPKVQELDLRIGSIVVTFER